jgi:hypothetical protein
MLSPPPHGAPTVAFSSPVSPTPRLNSAVTSCASLSPSPSAVGPRRCHLWPPEQTLPCVATVAAASTPHCRQLSPVSSRRLGVIRRTPSPYSTHVFPDGIGAPSHWCCRPPPCRHWRSMCGDRAARAVPLPWSRLGRAGRTAR